MTAYEASVENFLESTVIVLQEEVGFITHGTAGEGTPDISVTEC